jgi:hypothetical protein
MTTAERSTLFISLLAIIISLLGIYFQFFWKHDALSLRWYMGERGWATMTLEPAGAVAGNAIIKLRMSPSMVFINSGNTPIAIAGIRWKLLYNKNTEATNVWNHGNNPSLSACHDERSGGAIAPWQSLGIEGQTQDAHPLTIEPGRIVPLEIFFRDLEEQVDSTWRADSEVTTCIEVELIDANGRSVTRGIPALTIGTGGTRGDKGDAAIRLL